MSDSFWTSLPGILSGIAALIAVFWNNRKIEEIRHATNSMKDDLVRVTGEAEHAKGKIEGKAEEILKKP